MSAAGGDQTPRVVVGVDGSEASLRALQWALEEARLRQATLDVVHTWNRPVASEVTVIPVTDVSVEGARDRAEEVLDACLERVRPGEVPVERIVSEGSAAGVLIDVAQGAELLVVGSRGRGGFSSLLLGSVSHQCALHAPCPVAIVRTDPE